MPGMKFAFEKVGGRVYMKQVNEGRKTAEYALVKDEIIAMPDNWKKLTGKLVALNSCEGNQGGVPFKLESSGQKLVLYLKFGDGTVVQRAFNPVNESMAVEDGIGRDSGMIMKILPDGNLYFSGYRMQKQ